MNSKGGKFFPPLPLYMVMIRIQRILSVILTLIAAGSLLLPYVIHNSVNPLLPTSLAHHYNGWELGIACIAVILAIGSSALLFSRQKTLIIVAFYCTLLNGSVTLLIRKGIYFQESIDHHSDTSTGIGVHVLTCCVVGLILIALAARIYATVQGKKTKLPNPNLLDDRIN